MKFKDKILRKYLHDLTIDQLADDYLSNGWSISKNEKIGKFESDLIVRKDGKTIVFEIKAGKITGKKNEEIQKLSEEITKLGFEFRLVVPNPPQQKEIEFIGLEQLLFEEFINETLEELDALSSSTIVDEISDLEIDEIIITDIKDINVKGSGNVSITLEYGGGGDDGASMDDSYPFTFDIVVAATDKGFTITNVLDLKVDTSSFYE